MYDGSINTESLQATPPGRREGEMSKYLGLGQAVVFSGRSYKGPKTAQSIEYDAHSSNFFVLDNGASNEVWHCAVISCAVISCAVLSVL